MATINLGSGDFTVPVVLPEAAQNPAGSLPGLIRPRTQTGQPAAKPAGDGGSRFATRTCRGRGRPSPEKRAGVAAHLGNFKRTGNPVSLFKAGSVVIRQGRVREVLYGVRCFLTVRAAPVVASGVRGESFEPVVKDMLAIHHEIRPLTFAPELRRRFPVHLLPADLVTYTHIFAHSDDWMVVGEYADKSARMYYLNHDSCTPIPYYTKIEAVRHIHSVHRLSDTQVLVSTGDKAKLFDLWDDRPSGMTFSKRLIRRNGGFLSIAKVGDDDYFGTDFAHRPNYLYRYRDGKRWFFPQAGVHEIRAPPAGGGRSVSRLAEYRRCRLGGEKAWTVFDTQREVFIHAAASAERRRCGSRWPSQAGKAPVFGLQLPNSLAGGSPVLMQ